MPAALPRKAWEIRAHDTVADLRNSLARKVGRGELQLEQEVVAEGTGEGILQNGEYWIISVETVFRVKIARKLAPVRE